MDIPSMDYMFITCATTARRSALDLLTFEKSHKSVKEGMSLELNDCTTFRQDLVKARGN